MRALHSQSVRNHRRNSNARNPANQLSMVLKGTPRGALTTAVKGPCNASQTVATLVATAAAASVTAARQGRRNKAVTATKHHGAELARPALRRRTSAGMRAGKGGMTADPTTVDGPRAQHVACIANTVAGRTAGTARTALAAGRGTPRRAV